LAVLQLSEVQDALSVVKVAHGRKIVEGNVRCRLCGEPLPGREGTYVLKYFLLPTTAVTRTEHR